MEFSRVPPYTRVAEQVRISIDVPREVYLYRIEHNLKWKELIGLGYKAHQQNPQLVARISELEEINKKLAARLNTAMVRLTNLEGV